MKKCDICIEENCNGEKNCNCETCTKKEECNKVIHPIIRITTKCTQSCSHCCFYCSPKRTDMMSVKTAEIIKQFLIKNEILEYISIMGGEFVCNEKWKEIIEIIVPSIRTIRLVTNGDWDEQDAIYISQFKNINMSISKDKWHTNKNVDRAVNLCKQYNISFNVETEDQASSSSIVPVGRALDDFGSIYSLLGKYCSSNKYTVMIDENGDIFKCPFGILKMGNVLDFIETKFYERFKSFNQKFYNIFLPNCRRCYYASLFRKKG